MVKNVLGTELEVCCLDPLTGYMRDGFCHTEEQDLGQHWVCAYLTDAFLSFSLARGNDLVSPRLEFGFPGLKEGDGWCLCLGRWLEALAAGCAPPIKLRACHEKILQTVDIETLMKHAYSDDV